MKNIIKNYINILIKETINEVLNEGGNAIEGVNTVVPKELLNHNVEQGIKAMFGSKMNYNLIGNTNKDFLGDIDVAIDKTELMRLVDIQDPKDKNLYSKTIELVKNKNPNIEARAFPGLQMISVSLPLLDINNKQLAAIDKVTLKQTNNKIPGIYQMDLMIGNVDYLKQSMSAAGKNSSYKAVYRNLLLMQIFHDITWQDKNDPNIMYKLDAGTKEGVRLVKFKLLPNGKREKLEEPQIVSTNLDYAIEFIFGSGVSFIDVNTFEKLFKLFMSDKYKFPETRKTIIEGFKKLLKSKHLPPPKELS